ncbi:VanZ family protein [Curtobacterium sp. MWU13-2055]|uniref:VanZ family protein n=1 Tax=Curtobacterium sp. MWU13-2055 TaxID=2931928 RepID=UPI00200D6CC5|nr:VanZ family protein [Curtobacterium sp. MWU13-2055]
MTLTSTTGRAALATWIAGASAATLAPGTKPVVLEAASAVASIGHGALAVDQAVQIALATAVTFVPLPVLLIISFHQLRPVLAGALGAAVAGTVGAVATDSHRALVAVATAAIVGVSVGTLIAGALRARSDNRAPGRVRVGAVVALGAFLIAAAMIGFWHAPVDQEARPALDALLAHLRSAGAPEWLGYDFVEFAANIVFFAPLGLLLALALPPFRRWVAVVVGFTLSAGIEIGQGLMLPARSSSLDDLAANTAGTALGVAAGVVLVGWFSRRSAQARPHP